MQNTFNIASTSKRFPASRISVLPLAWKSEYPEVDTSLSADFIARNIPPNYMVTCYGPNESYTELVVDSGIRSNDNAITKKK